MDPILCAQLIMDDIETGLKCILRRKIDHIGYFLLATHCHTINNMVQSTQQKLDAALKNRMEGMYL